MAQRLPTSSVPSLSAAIILLAIAIAASALIYSSWFKACCMDHSRGFLAVILLPAMLVQLLLQKGNVHDGGAVQFAIGFAVELYVLWWVISWIRLRLMSRNAR